MTNNKPSFSDVLSVLPKSTRRFIALLVFIFGTIFIGIFPEKANELLGKRIISIYNYFSVGTWIGIGILVFVAILIWDLLVLMRQKKWETSKSDKPDVQVNTKIQQAGNQNTGKQSASIINNYFGDSVTKTEDQVETVADGILLAEDKIYKLQSAFVIEGDKEPNPRQYASIRVENVGDDEFRCYAKLTKLTKVLKMPNGENRQVIDLDEVNPKGHFLKWDNQQESVVLQANSPKIVRLVDKKGTFLFSKWESIYPFRGYDLPKFFEIEVELLRKSSNKFVKIETVTGMILGEPIVYRGGIHGYVLSWEKVKS